MTTLARPNTEQSSHWYTQDGQPCHTVKCSTKDGDRPTTIADAKKLGLVPSVTNVLGLLRKPALESWKIEQACLSVLTAPRNKGEELDQFAQRVLHEERQQDQEAAQAADLGTRIHAALEAELSGGISEQELLPWIEPVWEFINNFGATVKATEKVLVGDGYAGRVDLILDFGDSDMIIDFKSCKRLPTKDAYFDHKLQRAAYAKCHKKDYVLTSNLYISTTEPGQFVAFTDNMTSDWERWWFAFEHLLKYWQIVNQF